MLWVCLQTYLFKFHSHFLFSAEEGLIEKKQTININQEINAAFQIEQTKTELRWQLNKYDKPSESCTTGKYYKTGESGEM